MKNMVLAVMALGLLAGPMAADAVPVTWAYNGHQYEAVSTPDGELGLTWYEAKAAAEAAGGYLVTITSAEENAFIFDTFGLDGSIYWLGASRPSDDEFGWQWVTGESFVFTAWAPGEPNGFGFWMENYLVVAHSSSHSWNDSRSYDVCGCEWRNYRQGYVIEYDVPEPGTLALLGLGLAGLGFARRKKLS